MKEKIIALLPYINCKVALIGIRSVPNKVNEYDDRMILVIDGQIHSAYPLNTEPSVKKDGVATLVSGKKYLYKPGIHGLSRPPDRRYPAFVQASPVTVMRQNEGMDTGFFGINIHRGGSNSTSSLGCQTIPPDKWDSFKSKVYEVLDRFDQDTVPYYLLNSDNISVEALGNLISIPNAIGYSYYLDGKDLTEYGIQKKMIAGVGYVKTRLFASILMKIKPEEVPFEWNGDDLTLKGITIDLADETESVTWGSIRDVAYACGYDCLVDKEKQKVDILRK